MPFIRILASVLFLVSSAAASHTPELQPTIKASGASITVPSGGDQTTAFVTVDNPTMYDIYIVGAESEVAASIELRDATKGTPQRVKEVPVPAFGQLEMSLSSVHLVLSGLKKPLAAGDEVEIVLQTDAGDRVTVAAKAK